MLRSFSRRSVKSSTLLKRAAGTVAVTGGLTTSYYVVSTTEEQRRGLQRQAFFWSRLLPIVADYYWHFGSQSPRQWQLLQFNNDNEDNDKKERPEERKERLARLHARHAPQLLQVMLDLKGLYVKLGQVLSVTALPIPEIYREHFRTLQSDVPGYQEFEVVKEVLRQELHTDNLESIFAHIDPHPAGAASIGQAHRAVLRKENDDNIEQEEVIIKVQYPQASWQVPADIQCVGGLLKVCIWTGVVDESAARISFDDFARQFSAELDYKAEAQHLQETYLSSIENNTTEKHSNPYLRHGVLIPRIYPDLCTSKVITMSYLKGPKLEQEARKQLESLGIDTTKGIGNLVRAARRDQLDNNDDSPLGSEPRNNWKANFGQLVGRWVGIDNALWAFRNTKRVLLWSGSVVAQSMWLLAPVLPASWKEWREACLLTHQQSQKLALTGAWIDALLDVHGYQIFQQGLFNADCHPGNILVVEDGKHLALIDYGQCKRLALEEQAHVAELLLSVARKESDEQIATAFRKLGVKTRNDSTKFLAEMARLMFGRFETHHLNHSFHKSMHQMDRITYFPKELSMVYRTSLLLRGLAVSLQSNPSVAEHWQEHAQLAIDRYHAHQLAANVEAAKRRITTRIHHVRDDKDGLTVQGVA